MTRSEIQDALASPKIKPAALSMKDACRYICCGTTFLYKMINQGEIKSVVLKTDKNNILGKRVVLTASLDQYLERLIKA